MLQCEHSFVFFREWCGVIMQNGYSTCRFTFLLFRWLRKCLSLENTQKKDFLSFNKTSSEKRSGHSELILSALHISVLISVMNDGRCILLMAAH